METIKRSVVARGERLGRMGRRNTVDFQSNENTLDGTKTVDTYDYTFVQTHRMCNTKADP